MSDQNEAGQVEPADPAATTGWTDPATGLTGGHVPEPEYTHACQHCPKPLTRIQAGWVDPDGCFNCQKDLRHKPMAKC